MISGNVFWILSAVVQSGAALMGLTVAAYAFLWQLFDREEDEPQTSRGESIELFRAIRAWFHRRFSGVLVLLAASVFLGLSAMLWLPDQEDRLCTWQAVLTLLSIAALVAAVAYVVYIIWRYLDADLRTRIASQLASSLGKPPSPAPPATAGDFIVAFIELETLLRQASRRLGLPREQRSLRMMVPELVRAGTIAAELAAEIDQLIRLRNLVVHGEMREVSASNVEWVRSLTHALRERLTAE